MNPLVLLAPYFFEGGRLTAHDMHYVANPAGELTLAADTEFANDKVFGYTQSNLRAYVEEKTNGEVKVLDQQDCGMPPPTISNASLMQGCSFSYTSGYLFAGTRFRRAITVVGYYSPRGPRRCARLHVAGCLRAKQRLSPGSCGRCQRIAAKGYAGEDYAPNH